MRRSITIYYEDDSRPASNGAVEIISRDGSVGARLNSSGQANFNIAAEWVDKLILNGVEVKSDWDIGNEKNIEVWVKRKGVGKGYGKEMRLRYRDGRPVAEAEITVSRSGDVIAQGQSDSRGNFYLDPSITWADRIEADGTVVAEDVDLDKKSIDLEAQRAEEIGMGGREEGLGFFGSQDRPDRVVRGRVYMPNGRVGDVESVSVITDEGTFTDSSVRDGWFSVPLPQGDATDRMLGEVGGKPNIFINGQEPKTMFWDKHARMWTVMHSGGGSLSDEVSSMLMGRFLDNPMELLGISEETTDGWKGGLITGRAVTQKGSPLPDCKISANLGNDVFDMSFESSLGDNDWVSSLIMGSSNEPIAKTNKNGFFVLHLPYGDSAKQIFVDGDEPTKIVAGENVIPNRNIKPGSFNLTLWAPRKLMRDMFS